MAYHIHFKEQSYQKIFLFFLHMFLFKLTIFTCQIVKLDFGSKELLLFYLIQNQ